MIFLFSTSKKIFRKIFLIIQKRKVMKDSMMQQKKQPKVSLVAQKKSLLAVYLHQMNSIQVKIDLFQLFPYWKYWHFNCCFSHWDLTALFHLIICKSAICILYFCIWKKWKSAKKSAALNSERSQFSREESDRRITEKLDFSEFLDYISDHFLYKSIIFFFRFHQNSSIIWFWKINLFFQLRKSSTEGSSWLSWEKSR